MKRFYLALALPFLLVACKKSAIPTPELTTLLKPGATDSTEIVGNWALIATRHYSIPTLTYTSWKLQDTTQGLVIVEFRSDSAFIHSNNYAWQAQDYDRYSYLDTGFYANHPAFWIFATQRPTGNIANYPAFARLINPNALIIRYMGVDSGDEELYAHITAYSL